MEHSLNKMAFRFGVSLACVAISLLSACGGGGANASANPRQEATQGTQPIRMVSTPNPSVFPLLLALARDPSLPVVLLPVKNGSGIDEALTTQDGEGLLSMTWVAAAKVTKGVVPDLTLVSVNFWRGFSELGQQDSVFHSFGELVGKNLMLSGPVDGGRDGGPDQLFKAALKREGFDPSVYSESSVTITVNGTAKQFTRRHYHSGDFRVYYLPVMDASPVLLSGEPLDDGDGDTSNDMPAQASFMVDPAATGIVMNGKAQGVSINKAIDIQSLFSGYTSWPSNQLPLGGMSLRRAVLDDSARADEVARLRSAYTQAAYDLMNPGSAAQRLEMSNMIAQGVATYYGQYGLSIPAAVISAALTNGDLVYRADVSVTSIETDLMGFHQEILGTLPAVSFYGTR